MRPDPDDVFEWFPYGVRNLVQTLGGVLVVGGVCVMTWLFLIALS